MLFTYACVRAQSWPRQIGSINQVQEKKREKNRDRKREREREREREKEEIGERERERHNICTILGYEAASYVE